MQIRMEANQKYIDTILDKAFKIVSEQLSGFSISDQDLPILTSAGVMLSPADHLSSSVFPQLSVSSVSLHSPGGGKGLPHVADSHVFSQRPPEQFKRKSRWDALLARCRCMTWSTAHWKIRVISSDTCGMQSFAHPPIAHLWRTRLSWSISARLDRPLLISNIMPSGQDQVIRLMCINCSAARSEL